MNNIKKAETVYYYAQFSLLFTDYLCYNLIIILERRINNMIYQFAKDTGLTSYKYNNFIYHSGVRYMTAITIIALILAAMQLLLA